MPELQLIDIVHPGQPGVVASVPASALPHHQRAGWRLAEPTDLRAHALQILVDGGIDPDMAERLLLPADPNVEARDRDQNVAPASEAEPDQESKPRRQRAKDLDPKE
ncbi:hypothetical protein ACIBG7_43250 [Nonomuraea sp. NPDC050328]|uniref:hypothetical protein n=1 Tax=Nonomuraea sp. NPDC050328 TaxID=3364361 RepID=UPI003796E108